MKQKTIDGVTYYPNTTKVGQQYIPVIGFSSHTVTDNYYLAHHATDTRSKARTIAINHIKNIGK